MLSSIIAASLAGVLLLLFLLLASRDIFLLFASPSKIMGPGLARCWAVARTTLLEARASRVWLVPLLWVVASIIIMFAVRPFDPSERLPLYMRILLMAQEIILLLMIWVLACTSFPRERFHKIVVTNASKPISRLEMLLGKITGLICAAALLLVVMGAATYLILLFADNRIRAAAAAEYTLAQEDFHTKQREMKEAVEPPEYLKRLADEGSLFAYNYITVPKDGMSIVGNVITTPTETIRFIKGGSQERIVYRFAPRLVGERFADLMGPGQRPFFYFYFPVVLISPNPRDIPDKILLQVTAVRAKQRLREQQKMVVINRQTGYATWEPDDVSDLFTFPGERDNGEIEVSVACPTDGVLLQVIDGVPIDKLTTPVATSFNVLAFPGRAFPDAQAPQPGPIVRGFERHEKQQVAGPSKKEVEKYGSTAPLEAAIFRFPAADLAHVPIDNGNFTLSTMLDIDKEANQNAETRGWIEVYNQNSPTERFDTHFDVIEKRSVAFQIPAKFLGDTDPAKRGTLVVILRCETSGHWLSVDENAVRIEKPPEPFLLNLAKSEIVILLEASLFIIICVAWSVLLGWPVAMLTSAVFLFLGFAREFIMNLALIGGLGALDYPNFGNPSTSYKILDNLLEGLWHFLGFLVTLIPDFTRYDYLLYITQLRAMPLELLLAHFLWTIAYALPFIGLGYLFFRKQELG